MNCNNNDLINVPEPLCDVFEALRVGDIVDEHDPHRPAVVRRRYRVETLLTRRVPELSIIIFISDTPKNSQKNNSPNLQFDFLSLQLYRLYLEVDSCTNNTYCDNCYQKSKDKSLPMVEMNVVLKASSENLKRMQVLPTPESPIRRSLNRRSYVFLAILVHFVT